MRAFLSLSIAALFLAGCATTSGPVPKLRGEYYGAGLHRYSVQFTSVDGQLRTGDVIVIEPGEHTITAISLRPSAYHTTLERDIKIKLAPCKIYYMAAQHESGVSEQWTLVVDRVRELSGCKIE